MHLLAPEVILALVLADLPVDVDDVNGTLLSGDRGDSWWYLACECDDYYWNVADEVISLCSYSQTRELCFMKSKSGELLISRASPKVRELLQTALRFLGRFEFTGTIAADAALSSSIKEFDALDFGTRSAPKPEGQPVRLRCYAQEKTFNEEVRFLLLQDECTSIHFQNLTSQSYQTDPYRSS
jgi:hypothetical protein